MSEVTRAQVCIDQLVAALRERGLEVAPKLPALTVRNPAVVGEDRRGKAMSPGLRQQVLICDYETLGLTWCWVWPALRSAERGVPTLPPEVEPMCPAEEIARAADLITNVVRLRDPELALSADDV